ncbi:hypothetical protein K2P47_02985 [Patescibacteria group bacterium]|nr:hypothetical protein [Patescibacteria group bacterium]
MGYEPHFGDQIEPPRTDEDDRTERIFASEELFRQERALAWSIAEGLDYLPPLEDNPPAELRFAAE